MGDILHNRVIKELALRRMASDAALQTRIRDEFQTILTNAQTKRFKLTFTIAGKTFTAKLMAKSSHEDPSNLPTATFWFRVEGTDKNCIDVGVAVPVPKENGTVANLKEYRNYGYAEYQSLIQANTPVHKCFEPTLVSNRNNPDPAARYTATDVLQILKTKLQLLIPSPIPIPIELEDAAVIQNVRMTPFNVLRGKDPFYKKYGYVYHNLQPLLEHLPTVQWGSIKKSPYLLKQLKNKSTVIIYFYKLIPLITGKEYADTDLVMDIMKDISFEAESKVNTDTIQKYEPGLLNSMYSNFYLSQKILAAIRDTIPGIKMMYNMAVLDPASAEWQRSSERLQITGFEPVAEGGRRRRKTQKRKTKRRGKN
jgi:hypothetical protein